MTLPLKRHYVMAIATTSPVLHGGGGFFTSEKALATSHRSRPSTSACRTEKVFLHPSERIALAFTLWVRFHLLCRR
jgi:hypothetical protein